MKKAPETHDAAFNQLQARLAAAPKAAGTQDYDIAQTDKLWRIRTHLQSLATLAEGTEGELEVDNALVSEGDDNGAYVLTWTWVDFAGTSLDKDGLKVSNG